MAQYFAALLRSLNPRHQQGRRWLFVPYDQLSDQIGPLSREPAQELGIVLVECPAKAARRPYHKQKLAYVLANMRHFALEQARRGVAVRHLSGPGDYADILRAQCQDLGRLRVMEPAERELRQDLSRLELEIIPHEGWLTTPEQFLASSSSPPWRMDAFYRQVRRDSGILMERGRPLGGKFSYDAENRKPWKGHPTAPTPPQFPDDPVKAEVLRLIQERFAHHPGHLDGSSLPATLQDAGRLWSWARHHCLPHFGPYEDAMSLHSSGLFHTRISPLLNLHRLLPAQLVREVESDQDLPLPCREGFIRQILGWREFVRHVHRQTDGFRSLGDPARLEAGWPLPPAFWGRPSGLACLDEVVRQVWREGYSHHITRLMVLCCVASLLGVSPRQLTDWFWAAYIDAYDWVVEPNVLAMGTYAVGPIMTTKPYVAGSAYIHKMSDYCGACRFHPDTTCPLKSLYWAYLQTHQTELQHNPRMGVVLRSLQKRSPAQQAQDLEVLEQVRSALARGQEIRPKQT